MKYLLKKKFWALLGGEFVITNEQQEVVAFAKQKAFKLREEILVTTDIEKTQPLFSIKARNIIDFHGTYDIVDAQTGAFLGALRRKGFHSMIRDEWEVLAEGDRVIGIVKEESGALALVRRFLTNIIPQRYDLRIGEVDAGGFTQQFNLFLYNLEIDVDESLLDRRVAFATAILLGAIEGKQE
jgi:hypothetical protein